MTPIKIGFVLPSNSKKPIPSTRISVLNLFPFLIKSNFNPKIAYEPEVDNETPDVDHIYAFIISEGFKIIYFQKVHGDSVVKLANKLAKEGIKTIYGVCDLVNISMAEATNATIAVSEYLKSLYPPEIQHKISVVHDGLEHTDVYKTSWGNNRGSRSNPLHAVLVTSLSLSHLPVLESLPSWLKISIVGRYSNQTFQRLREYYWTFSKLKHSYKRQKYLKFLFSRKIERVTWDPVGVYEAMKQADIGIIPIDQFPVHDPNKIPPSWRVKSENRLTMKMSMGLPVIASPIPSYESVISQNKNGFIAHSTAEWIENLETLRDPQVRIKVGISARKSVIKKYSTEEQARLFIDSIRNVK